MSDHHGDSGQNCSSASRKKGNNIWRIHRLHCVCREHKHIHATVQRLCSPAQARSFGFCRPLVTTFGTDRVQAHRYAPRVALWAAFPHEGCKILSSVCLTEKSHSLYLEDVDKTSWADSFDTTEPAGLTAARIMRVSTLLLVLLRNLFQPFPLLLPDSTMVQTHKVQVRFHMIVCDHEGRSRNVFNRILRCTASHPSFIDFKESLSELQNSYLPSLISDQSRALGAVENQPGNIYETSLNYLFSF